MRYAVSEQGSFKFTTSATDLGVKGNGFFVVSNDAGQTFLTRAGSFVPDGDGNLVNAAGFKLMGYPTVGGNPNIVANGTAGLTAVSIGSLSLQAVPSAAGNLAVNLPSNDPRCCGRQPSVRQYRRLPSSRARPRSSPSTTWATR